MYKQTEQLPRGFRNNNPGNILDAKGANGRYVNDWIGLAEVRNDGKFCRFRTMPDGIRAMVVLITGYCERGVLSSDGTPIDTVQEVLERYAPDVENPTNEYADFVRRHMGYQPGQKLNHHCYDTMFKLIDAMIRFENGGMAAERKQIEAALRRCNLMPDAPPLKKDKTMKAAKIAGSAALATPVADSMSQFTPALPVLDRVVQWIRVVPPWVWVVLVLAGVGWVIWERYDDAMKGLR